MWVVESEASSQSEASSKTFKVPCIEEPGYKARMACHANTVLYKAFIFNVNKETLEKSYKLFCM